MHFSTIIPNARFVCVEPDPDNLPLLRKNLEANRIDANVVPLAVGSARRTRDFYRYRPADAHSLLPQSHSDLFGLIQIQALSLADIPREAGVHEIDLVKIDVEGRAEKILADAHDWLPRVQAVVMETHPDLVSTSRPVDSFQDNGFAYFPMASGMQRADSFLSDRLARDIRSVRLAG